MYQDTKNYLVKYWKELLFIVFSFVALGVGIFYLTVFSYISIGDYSKRFSALSTCTNILKDFIKYDKETESRNYDLFGFAFDNDQDYKKPNGCKYTVQEQKQGLDVAYEDVREEILAYFEINKKIDKNLDFINNISNSNSLSDQEFLLKYKKQALKYISEEEYVKFTNREDFFSKLYTVYQEMIAESEKSWKNLNEKIDNQEIREAIQNVGRYAGARHYYYTFGIVLLISVVYLILGLIFFWLTRIVDKKWPKMFLGTASFVAFIGSLVIFVTFVIGVVVSFSHFLF